MFLLTYFTTINKTYNIFLLIFSRTSVKRKPYQKFLNEQIKEHDMKHIKLLVFSPYDDFKVGGLETRKKAPCVLYNLAKRSDLSESQKKLKKTKWYDNLLTEDFKLLNIKKHKKLL